MEVTDLRESSLLLYFCRINWAQDRLSLIIKTLALLPLCPNGFPFHRGSEPQLEETILEEIENNSRKKTQNLGGNALSLFFKI